ncbi:MAG: response regulator [Chitinophagaceae bacterium]
MEIRLGIIEDDVEMISSLVGYLSSPGFIKVVAMGHSVEEFIQLHDSHVEIDVVLMDVMLPGVTGIEGIRMLKERWPYLNILINTVLEDTTTVFDALRSGAIGYLTKETPLESIKDSIVNAHKGMSVMNPGIASKIVEFFSTDKTLVEKLSDRELTIANYLKDGWSYKMIAIDMHLSIDTIRSHIRSIYRKLEINSKGELISLMMRRRV